MKLLPYGTGHQKFYLDQRVIQLALICGVLAAYLLKCLVILLCFQVLTILIYFSISIGDSEIDEIFRIFRLLGTPTDETWAGVTDLPDWKPSFPNWKAQDLKESCQKLCPEGVSLLEVC